MKSYSLRTTRLYLRLSLCFLSTLGVDHGLYCTLSIAQDLQESKQDRQDRKARRSRQEILNKQDLEQSNKGQDAWGNGIGQSTSSTSKRSQNNKQFRKKLASADGRLSIRSYVSGDQSQTYDSPTVMISFLESDVHAYNLTDSGLALHLDATFILDISQSNERRFGETERFDQVRQLYISHDLGRKVSAHVGRRLLHYAGNAWVDGLEVQLHLDHRHMQLGIYGGLSPDRFDRSLTVEYQALGTFFDWHRQTFDLSLAYNVLLYQSNLDRTYLYQRSHIKLMKGLFFSDYLIVDLLDEVDVTTFLSTIDYTPIDAFNIALTASRYSLEQYRNQSIYRNIIEPNQALILGNESINLVYHRLRFSASLQINKNVYHYQMIEYKARAQDGRTAHLYTLGVRHKSIFNSGVEIDFQTQFMKHFRSDSVILALSAYKDFSKYLSIDARITRFKGRTLDQDSDRVRIFDEAQDIYLMGLSLIYRANKRHRLSFAYDTVYESELQDLKSDDALWIHTGMLKYSFLF